MSHVYNPTPVAITNTTLPDDNDLASAVSVNTPLENIADGVKYVQNAIDGTSLGTCVPADLNVGAGLLAVDASGGGTITAGAEFVAAGPVTCVSTTEHIGAVTCDSTLTAIGAVTCSSTLHVVGAVTCASSVAISGDLTVRTNRLIVNAAGVFSFGELGVSGNVELGDSPADIVTINGSCISYAVNSVGTGGYRTSSVYEMTDGNVAAYTPASHGEIVYVPPAILSTNREINVVNSGAYIGCTIRIFSHETTWKVTVKNGGVTLGEVVKTPGAGQYEWMDIAWTVGGGGWVISGGQRF